MPITSTIQQGTLSLTAVTPGNSAIGDAAAAGTSASVARADHVHGREAAGTAGASAVGDTAAAGSATTVARSDHRHSREAFGTPVNLDASVTSLSAGSLTTVARADHVHTVSKVPVLIGSTNITTTTASYTFSSIPQSYATLWIVASYRGDDTNPTYGTLWAQAQFNGDTGTNYVTTNGASQTSILLGYTMASNNFYPSSATANMAILPCYSLTTVQKPCTALFSANNRAASAQMEASITGGLWLSTSAITSIKIFPMWGNFRAGTTISLYGLV